MVPKNNSTSEFESGLLQQDGSAPGRVLLAEDDRSSRRFLSIVLERAGYKVFVAEDGLEAMKLAISTPVDIVVTDATMPNLSGHELCRFLRNSPSLSHLPVILLSAHTQKEPDKNVEQVDAFLLKPVSGEDLVACVEKLLSRQ